MSSYRRLKLSVTHFWFITQDTLNTLWNALFGRIMKIKPGKHQELTNEEYNKSETSTRTEQTYGPRLEEEEDTVDFPVNNALTKALETVSQAIYKVSFSTWHKPPEEVKRQPVYKEINSVIKDVYFNIKSKSRPLEEYQILISIAEGMIVHLKNFRKKNRRCKYNSRQEEVDFLRKHTLCLLKYWLPESLESSRFSLVFLTELISINVLEPMINNLADFKMINQSIVMALDNEEASEQKIGFDIYREMIVSAVSSNIMESDNIKPGKTKKKGFRKTLIGMVTRSKNRKRESAYVSGFRSHAKGSDDNTTDYMDGDTDMDFQDSNDGSGGGDNDDSIDIDDRKISISDKLLQKWIKENWIATICQSQAEKEHEFEICVTEEAAPNNELWNTERSEYDFELIYDKLYKKYKERKVFKKSKTTEKTATSVDSQFFQTIDATPEEIIDVLLDLIKIHHEPEAAFFLSPFNYQEERELFYETLPDIDEELLTGQFVTEDPIPVDSCDIGSDSDDCYESDGYRSLLPKTKKTDKKHTKRSELEDKSNTIAERNEASPSENSESRTEFSSESPEWPLRLMESPSPNPHALAQNGFDVTGYNFTQVQPYGPEKAIEKERKILQETFLDVLYRLADELFAGGTGKVRLLHKIGWLDAKSKDILSYISDMFAEEQIEQYLNQLCELLSSKAYTSDLSPGELQAKALELLERKVQSLLTYKIVKFLFEREILKSLKASHKSLQDLKANKETVFGLLEDLTRIITDEKRDAGS